MLDWSGDKKSGVGQRLPNSVVVMSTLRVSIGGGAGQLNCPWPDWRPGEIVANTCSEITSVRAAVLWLAIFEVKILMAIRCPVIGFGDGVERAFSVG